MAIREDQPDPLYIVHDGERIIVALDMPGVHGAVEDSVSGTVELTWLVPYPATRYGSQMADSTVSEEPPGLGAAKAWYGAGAVVGLSAGAVGTRAVSLGLWLPLALATLVAAAGGDRRAQRGRP